MTDEMTPLPQPPFDYISVGPYSTSLEWPDGRIIAEQFPTLEAALRMLWARPFDALGSPTAPSRRVIFDARGTVVFGFIDHVVVKLPVVCTRELIDIQEQLGGDAVALVELRVNVLWSYEGATP